MTTDSDWITSDSADELIAENTSNVDEAGNVEEGTLDEVYGNDWSLDTSSQY